MIRFLTLFAALLVLNVPAMAQDNTESAPKPKEASTSVKDKVIEKIDALKSDGNEKERLKLSKEMHEIWPIRQKIEEALTNIAERLPQQERLKFKSAMRSAIDFDELQKASTDSMADIFTEAELKKMIAFYGSKEGRSVSYKTSDYQKTLQPLMVKMIDKALLDVKMGTPKAGAQSQSTLK